MCTAQYMVRTSRRQTRSAVATITRLSDLCLDGSTTPEPVTDPTLRVTIHNVVATASFGATFDLEQLAWRCYGEYTPRQAPPPEIRKHTLNLDGELVVRSGGAK